MFYSAKWSGKVEGYFSFDEFYGLGLETDYRW